MKKNVKKMILQLLDTITEGMLYIFMDNVDAEEKQNILEESKYALLHILSQFEIKDIKSRKIEEEVKKIICSLDDQQMLFEEMNHQLIKLKEQIKEIEVKIEIVFLPYKYSMWDCMESIWENANRDIRCSCHIIPIPYYELEADKTVTSCIYEGHLFKVPIEDYRAVSLQELSPDIIYFHNPFDYCNKITTVLPEFYSSNLKAATDMLVYIPYCLSGYLDKEQDLETTSLLPGIQNADYIITQGERLSEVFVTNGIPPSKVKALGSPKVDAIITNDCRVPMGWTEAIKNRKCILLNTSLSTFLSKKNWVDTVKEMIETILQNESFYLIWRPHPLLRSTIKNMRPQFLDKLDEIFRIVEKADNAALDLNGSALESIELSDALISDYSSLMFQYLFSGKPVLSITGKKQYKSKVVFCDYFDSEFVCDGCTVNDFLDEVHEGRNTNKDKRLAAAKQSVVNADGTCGQKVHKFIMEQLQVNRLE